MEERKTFNLYKGLKKPLTFKGFKGKYIYHAAGFLILTLVMGLVLTNLIGMIIGLLVSVGIGGGLIYKTTLDQKNKGLYKKTKNFNQLHIVKPKRKIRRKYEKHNI